MRRIQFEDVVSNLTAEARGKRSLFSDPPQSERIRATRGILDALKRTIDINLELPPVNYILGDPEANLGISVGLIMENSAKVKASLPASEFSITVHNEAFCTVRLGIVGFQLDLFRAKIEYRGSTGYDINAIAAGGPIGEYTKILEKFDKVVRGVVTTTQNVMCLVNCVILSTSPSCSHCGGPQPSVEFEMDTVPPPPPPPSVSSCPPQQGHFFERAAITLSCRLPSMLTAVSTVIIKSGKTVDEAIQTFKTQNLKEAEELLLLFKDIMDSLIGSRQREIARFVSSFKAFFTDFIPGLWRDSIQAIQTIGEAFQHILRCPTTVMAGFSHSVNRIAENVAKLLSVRDEVMDCVSVLQGSPPDWLYPTEEFEMLGMFVKREWPEMFHLDFDDLLFLFLFLLNFFPPQHSHARLTTHTGAIEWAKKKAQSWKDSAAALLEQGETTTTTESPDGGFSLTSLDMIKTSAAFDKAVSFFTAMSGIMSDIQTTVKDIKSIIEDFPRLMTTIQTTISDLMDTFETVTGDVDEVFGAQMHQDFPNTLSTKCSNGAYPSNAGDSVLDSNYEFGIDLDVKSDVDRLSEQLKRQKGPRNKVFPSDDRRKPRSQQRNPKSDKIVVAPTNGILKPLETGKYRVMLHPEDRNFRKYRILIYNVQLDNAIAARLEGKYSRYYYVKAGDRIGVVKRMSSKCNDFIHVSFRTAASSVAEIECRPACNAETEDCIARRYFGKTIGSPKCIQRPVCTAVDTKIKKDGCPANTRCAPGPTPYHRPECVDLLNAAQRDINNYVDPTPFVVKKKTGWPVWDPVADEYRFVLFGAILRLGTIGRAIDEIAGGKKRLVRRGADGEGEDEVEGMARITDGVDGNSTTLTSAVSLPPPGIEYWVADAVGLTRERRAAGVDFCDT